MCGMLGGGAYAHHIRKWSGDHKSADLVSRPPASCVHTYVCVCVYMYVHACGCV